MDLNFEGPRTEMGLPEMLPPRRRGRRRYVHALRSMPVLVLRSMVSARSQSV
ncbi:MAG TPA: hypothetical protein VN888_10120 [Mycobacterium sp.]|nr:hypothetical protein [Mycobacterium sp.]